MSSKQKKIILAVSNDLVSDNRVHKVACTLSEEGYQVLVLGRKLSTSLALPKLPYATKRFSLIFSKGSLFYAELNVRIFIFLLFSRADIFTANDLDTLLAVYCAAKLRNKSIVYDSHEYFTEVPELVLKPRTKKIWEQIEKHIFPKLKHCITVCESIAQVYRSKYHVPVHVVRNVPFLQSHPTSNNDNLIPNKNFTILYQGAVNIGRGINLMIESMQYLENTTLIIVGKGDILQEMKTLAIQKQVMHKIEFLGQVHFSKLPPITQKADIGISAEENIGLNYYYALPNKVFDYIQAHKPILVSDLPEMRAIIETYSCGEIIRSREPKEFAMQIQEMLHNSNLYLQYKKNAEQAAQELCWEQEKQKLLEVYAFSNAHT